MTGEKKEMSDMRFEMTIPCEPRMLLVVRLALTAFAAAMNMTVNAIEDIKRAVTEACTNAIQHAYPNARHCGTVHIACWVEGNEGGGEVSDEGIGMSSPEGLGIMIMRALMDEVEIKVERGTKVRMVKRIEIKDEE